jgi:hypothetical protein
MNQTANPPDWRGQRQRTPIGAIEAWLDYCEANLTANVAGAYRRRFNEHPIGYSTLLATTGFSALAAGTSGHLIIDGLIHPVHRAALAASLSILICLLPFAVWSHTWAAKVDRDDPVAAWSRPRHNLAAALLWACVIVGAIRLLFYVETLLSALLSTHPQSSGILGAGALNVGFSLSISVSLGIWAYNFLHRFDNEDPSVPPDTRRRRRQ